MLRWNTVDCRYHDRVREQNVEDMAIIRLMRMLVAWVSRQPLFWNAELQPLQQAIFGGSSVEAAKIYRKSEKLYEADREGLKYNWLYLNTLRSLADAYMASEMYREANEVYLKMLRVEPRLKWMTEKVYPEFLKRYQGKF